MSDAARPPATVIVVPRESFTNSLRCFDRLLECTPAPRRIVYVDGGSPEAIARALAARAAEADVALVRTDCILYPNRARNLALELLPADDDSRWTAFVDNDAYVEPQWLARLCECADESGAAAVVPLLCIGEPVRARVHVAGGDAAIEDRGADGRYFVESHPLGNEPVASVRATLVRRKCRMFEFHTVLFDTARLRAVAPLDEGLRSLLEHIDLGLELQGEGGEIWFEPAVEVTYLPAPVRRQDARRYFVTRWSDEWNVASARRFREKWRLAADDPEMHDSVEFGAWMRARAYLPYRSPFVHREARRGRYPRSLVDRIAQHDARRWYRRQAAASGPPRVVHRASWLEEPVDA